MMESMALPIALRDMILAGTQQRENVLPAMGEEEFRLFYERTARPLWSYLARITGDRTKADDFLQEAFYRFYRAGARHETESHRRNSLFQIATNVVRDAARHNARYAEVPVSDEMPEKRHGRVAEEVAARMDVHRAMKRLQPIQREILWLAYAQGSSHDEIAEILGVRSISVRTLLLRARRKLAALLEEARR